MNINDKIILTKYTIVGVFCTLFSMFSYPTILYFLQQETYTYIIATSLNILTSYLLQSAISFSLMPNLRNFFKYIYVSLGIIIIGNIAYFIIYCIISNGVISYYASWILTSITSYLSHYKYTFKD